MKLAKELTKTEIILEEVQKLTKYNNALFKDFKSKYLASLDDFLSQHANKDVETQYKLIEKRDTLKDNEQRLNSNKSTANK
jgi:hypothetical protein